MADANYALYMTLKGFVSEMTPEQRQRVENARAQAWELLHVSAEAHVGVTLACMQYDIEADTGSAYHVRHG